MECLIKIKNKKLEYQSKSVVKLKKIIFNNEVGI
jgi:hypothetical protein